MAETTIFVSYRRSDSSAATGRIADRLQAHFGNKSVFYDVDTIPLGIDFRQYLNERLDQCDVFLAVIGDQWLEVRDAEGNRRLDQAADNVRLEVSAALQREELPVIPVLVGKASVPKEADLPANLKDLAYRNAITVRSDADFDGQMARLITAIDRIVGRTSSGHSAATEVPGPSAAAPAQAGGQHKPDPAPAATATGPRLRSGWLAIGAAIVVLAGLGLWYAKNAQRSRAAADGARVVTEKERAEARRAAVERTRATAEEEEVVARRAPGEKTRAAAEVVTPPGWSYLDGKLYRFVPRKVSWPEAQKLCKRWNANANLASVHSAEENEFVARLCFEDCGRNRNCNSESDCWIGLHDRSTEGQLIWTDGTRFTWSPGEFRWNRPDRDCFVLDGHHQDGTWEGDVCETTKKFFVCKRHP